MKQRILTLMLLCAMVTTLCACGASGEVGPGTGTGGATTNGGAASVGEPSTGTTADTSTGTTTGETTAQGTTQDPADGPAGPGETEEPQHDFTPGNENTLSTPRPSLRFKSQNDNIAYQDQMIYYQGTDESLFYKLPAGAPKEEAQVIWSDPNGTALNWTDVQVLGDWVYVQEGSELYRFSSIPGKFQLLLEDLDCLNDNQVVIRNDEIYYLKNCSVQVSAQSYENRAELFCYHIETGETTQLASITGQHGMSIESYTDETILLMTWQDGDRYFYHYDTGELEIAPNVWDTGGTQGVLSDGHYYYSVGYRSGVPPYREGGSELYRHAPENGYEPEMLHFYGTNMYMMVYVADEDLALGSEHVNSIEYAQGDEVITINWDRPGVVCWPGDGYVYYRSSGQTCRVLLDGTGWEQL